MGAVLGLGVTHYPGLSKPVEDMTRTLRLALADAGVPAELKDPNAWPEAIRAEWAADDGYAASLRHRDALVAGLRKVRQALDDWRPDVVVVWGDDQYELFREEVIPPFCLLNLDRFEFQPWAGKRAERPNPWGEAPDTTINVRGAREIGVAFTSALIERGFDMSYSYALPTDRPFPHAIANTVLYLDYDRRGFDHPLLPMTVNCYGRNVIARKGGITPIGDLGGLVADPAGPTPQRCLAVGAAIADIALASPWRVALVASSSWSHAFLCDELYHLHPDMEADRRYYAALIDGDAVPFEAATTADIERAGQQEMLNWFCLLGAMRAVGSAPRWTQFTESWICNSNKCFAIFDQAVREPG